MAIRGVGGKENGDKQTMGRARGRPQVRGLQWDSRRGGGTWLASRLHQKRTVEKITGVGRSKFWEEEC